MLNCNYNFAKDKIYFFAVNGAPLISRETHTAIGLPGRLCTLAEIQNAHDKACFDSNGKLYYEPIKGTETVKNPKLNPRQRAAKIQKWRDDETKLSCAGNSDYTPEEILELSDDAVAEIIGCDAPVRLVEKEYPSPYEGVWTEEMLAFITVDAMSTARIDSRYSLISLQSKGDIQELLMHLDFCLTIANVRVQKDTSSVTKYKGYVECGYIPVFTPPSYMMELWLPFITDVIKHATITKTIDGVETKVPVRTQTIAPLRHDGTQPQMSGSDIWVSRLDAMEYLGLSSPVETFAEAFLATAVANYIKDPTIPNKVPVPKALGLITD